MRIVVLYCSFFFPFSYVIAKNGYVEQNSAKYYSLTEQDTLYIETEKTEFEIQYRLCFNQQGKKNIVFELKAVDDSSIDFVQSYTINGIRKFDCFAVYDNVADGNRFLFFDYKSQIAYITSTSSDTLSIDSKVTYVPFNCNNRIIKATFVPCSQAGKDNNISTTKDSIRSMLLSNHYHQ